MKEVAMSVAHIDSAMHMQNRLGGALAVIDQAVEEYQPALLFALFSGGHDSLTTTHIASRHPAFSGVIHVNTGIGIPETNEFVRETCREHGWTLHELHPVTRYEDMVTREGFPGHGVHPIMYRHLKERPLEHFLARAKARRRDKVVLCAGVRKQESTTRMGNVEPVRLYRSKVWASPIHDWSATEVTMYLSENGLRRNPVKDLMHISGECLCGCYADMGERDEIAAWYPHVHERLCGIEEDVRSSSGAWRIPTRRQTWGWSARETPQAKGQLELPMCFYCHAGREESEVQS